MKINIVAVGKIKEKFLIDGIAEYSKRLSAYAVVNQVEVPEETSVLNVETKSIREGERLLEKARGFKIGLDSKGLSLDSKGLSKLIHSNMINGISEISFIIGGSNGLSANVKNSCDMLLSFGKFTFPHQLFRLMLYEQIYRSFTIINNTPYHKWFLCLDLR